MPYLTDPVTNSTSRVRIRTSRLQRQAACRTNVLGCRYSARERGRSSIMINQQNEEAARRVVLPGPAVAPKIAESHSPSRPSKTAPTKRSGARDPSLEYVDEMTEAATAREMLHVKAATWDVEDALRVAWPRSVRTAYGMLGCMHSAQDAVQEACLIAYRKRSTIRDPAAFEKWFLTIVVRQAYAASKKMVCLEADVVPTSGYDVATLVDVRRALDRLSPKVRAAIVLCDMMRYTSDEAALFLGCPASTIRNRIFRGRSALSQMLFDYKPER